MTQSIFNLALDFYKSPSTFKELVDPSIPLPTEVAVLLDRFADGKPAEAGWMEREDLRAAILFLVEQVFFAAGSDYYRILGVKSDAGFDRIQQHYKSLLHLLSLDRIDKAGEWNTDYAIRINRAYSVLRDPERRQRYDRETGRPSNWDVSSLPERGPEPSPGIPGNVAYFSSRPNSEADVPASAYDDDGSDPVPSEHSVSEGRRPASFIASSVDRARNGDEPVSYPRARVPRNPREDDFPLGIPAPDIAERLLEHAHREERKSRLAFLIGGLIVIAGLVALVSSMLAGPAGEATDQAVSAGSSGTVSRDVLPEVLSVPEPPGPNDAAVPEGTATIDAADPASEYPSTAADDATKAPTPPSVDPEASNARQVVAAAPRQAEIKPAPKPSARAVVPPSSPKRTPAAARDTEPGPQKSPADRLESMRDVSTQPAAAESRPETRAAMPKVPPPAVARPVSVPPPATAEATPAADASSSDAAVSGALAGLAASFANAYRQGDLDGLMSLFTEDASTNDRSGKAAIAGDYRELFSLTEQRSFTVDDLRWTRVEPGLWRGEGSFRVDIKLKNGAQPTSMAGRLTIEARRDHQQFVIERLLHAYQ
jgi:curved DNA-binding protein CbpA/ketosteroid isomerase-like protein